LRERVRFRVSAASFFIGVLVECGFLPGRAMKRSEACDLVIGIATRY
jgi:hypothetical protein